MHAHLAKRLFDARSAALRIKALTRTMTFAEFESDEVIRLAGERLLEIMGEALAAALRIDPELESRFPEMRRAVSLRNRIIHGYDDINDVVIWDIVQTNLPPLVQLIEDRLSENSRERPGT